MVQMHGISCTCCATPPLGIPPGGVFFEALDHCLCPLFLVFERIASTERRSTYGCQVSVGCDVVALHELASARVLCWDVREHVDQAWISGRGDMHTW